MISDLNNLNDNWIYQSNKLIEASYTLTVLEQKILRILASMIKKEDKDFKEYEFKAKDLMKIFNTKNKRFYKDIDQLTDLLMQRIIKIKDINTNEFIKYHWIDVAKYKNGILKLKINPLLKPFYLNLDWYTKYQLKNILQFKSTYSFRFYELLKQYLKVGERTFIINDLKLKLDIGEKEYPKYANLKQKVIKVAVSEINKFTDLHIDFEEIKTGRKVTGVKFYIKYNEKNITKKELVATLEEDQQDSNYIKDVQDLFDEQISFLEAKKILSASNYNMDLINKKYTIAKNASNIKNIVAWMIKAIKDDYKEPKISIKVDRFNDYPQRSYDFENLEKKLLGGN